MSNIQEYYLTINQPYGPEEFKEKGSRFISYLYPVINQSEVETNLSHLKKKYYDSTHICFAFRLGNGKDEYYRFSDNGEPGGTAGIPILNEIKNKNYFNILAIVIRYFGGTKLGTGGLVRAYSAITKKVMDLTSPIPIYLKKEGILFFPYDLIGDIMQVVNRYSTEIITREYSDKGVSLTLSIPISQIDEISHSIFNISNGKVSLITKSQKELIYGIQHQN